MKQLYIISTGRCGTKRLKEILEITLPADDFTVIHQVPGSRIANVLGNLMYYFGSREKLKRRINHKIHKHASKKYFISSDPLTSMVIPMETIVDPNVMVLHVSREKKAFARSFFNLSRSRLMSFIAHNFIPFWQIDVWPLENLFKNHIIKKYEKVWELKNAWFEKQYRLNPNYLRVDMDDVFKGEIVEQVIARHFEYPLQIPGDMLRIRSNQSA